MGSNLELSNRQDAVGVPNPRFPFKISSSAGVFTGEEIKRTFEVPAKFWLFQFIPTVLEILLQHSGIFSKSGSKWET